MSEWFPVQFADQQHDPHVWSAQIYPGDMHCQSVTIHICSPVLSSVGLYHVFIHLQTIQKQRTYAMGTFVLLFNPWLKGWFMYKYSCLQCLELLPLHEGLQHCVSDDPVYMPLDVQKEEYIKSDYGLLYMGSSQNISRRPWSFGQVWPSSHDFIINNHRIISESLQVQFCFFVCTVWAWGSGSMSAAPAGQPTAPHEWTQRLHSKSRPCLCQQGGLCYGEKQQTITNSGCVCS